MRRGAEGVSNARSASVVQGQTDTADALALIPAFFLFLPHVNTAEGPFRLAGGVQ